MRFCFWRSESRTRLYKASCRMQIWLHFPLKQIRFTRMGLRLSRFVGVVYRLALPQLGTFRAMGHIPCNSMIRSYNDVNSIPCRSIPCSPCNVFLEILICTIQCNPSLAILCVPGTGQLYAYCCALQILPFPIGHRACAIGHRAYAIGHRACAIGST